MFVHISSSSVRRSDVVCAALVNGIQHLKVAWRCQESGRPYSRAFTSAVYNVKLGDQRHVVAVAYMMSDTLMLRHVVAVVYMTSDMLMLRSDVVVRR